ncbi:hypothetical protein [Streptomyces anandii]|uniref:hypothetical protein n=1 Tax=Streptomyces anandii TaxID=285454 RepID=UPI000A7720F3|nr:hypothetical protein [Streptomyces anandii]GGX94750.1 hypothetical protein GCM10010510_44990 [Streptomyces anandii JCM 4720]
MSDETIIKQVMDAFATEMLGATDGVDDEIKQKISQALNTREVTDVVGPLDAPERASASAHGR